MIAKVLGLSWLVVLLPVLAIAQTQSPNTPVACATTTVATGGTAVSPLAASANGYYITNPLTATDQGIGSVEPLYLDVTKAATTTGNGTNLALQPGQTFYGIPQSTVTVSVNAATSGHKFVCVQW